MRVLVTGASGYLGLHLLQLLRGTHEVTAIVRDPRLLGELRGGVVVVQADLRDAGTVADAMHGQDCCVHLALLWGAPGTELDLPDTRVAARLFETAGEQEVARCVYVSSTAVHRPFRPGMVEGDRLQPTDLYGMTKAAGELALWAAASRHRMEGIVVRPGPMVGPPALPRGACRGPRVLREWVDAARAGEALRVPAGGRQLVAVRDVARALVQLISAEEVHDTYICVDRRCTPWRELAQAVMSASGSASELRMAVATPSHHFETGRIEELLGVLDSREAAALHIEHELRR